MRTPYPNELIHYGISGMRWGVRNGPPYPLDSNLSKKIRGGQNERVRYSNQEYQDRRSGKIKTDKSEKAGTTHYGNFNESRLREVINASDLPKPMNVAEIWESNPNFKRDLNRHGQLTDWDVQVVNKDITNSDETGLRNNCVKSSMALELRRRGYDVVAGRSSHGMLSSAAQYYWDGATPYKERYDNIQKRIDSFGRGGTGEFIAWRPDGSAHSVYFRKEKGADGIWRQRFDDGQIGKSYSSLEDLYRAEGYDKTRMGQITRLDNATPNFKHMAEDSIARVSFTNPDMNRIENGRNAFLFTTGTRWTG